MFSFRRPTDHVSGDSTRTDDRREIKDDVVAPSPKVYESGVITNLDLRLVDLRGDGDCAVESRDTVHDAPPPEPGY